MKKVLTLIISFALLFGLAACSGNNENDNQASGPRSEKVSEESKTPTVDSETESNEAESKENISGQTKGSNILIAYFSRVG